MCFQIHRPKEHLCLLFLKLNESRNGIISFGVFSSKTKNAQILLKMKTLTRVRLRVKILYWTSKIIPDLWLLDLFCPIKINFHTPPYCTVTKIFFQSYSFHLIKAHFNDIHVNECRDSGQLGSRGALPRLYLWLQQLAISPWG